MVRAEDSLDGASTSSPSSRSLALPLVSSSSSRTLHKSRPRLSTVLKTGSYGKGKQAERPSFREESFVPLRSFNAGAPPLVRRLSHPLPQQYAEVDDGDFIKKAFENLSVEPARQSFSAPRDEGGSIPTFGNVSLMEMLNNDDPLGVGVSIRRIAAKNTSRSSLASSISSPPSAASFADRSSLASTKPLLATGNGNGKIRTPSSGGRLDSENTPRLSESSFQWTDPFEDANSRLRLRRRSTISGYSVTSSDWLSLRRGSHVSLENGPTSNSRSNNGSLSDSPFSGPDVSGSMRWEQWALAYKDTMLQHMQANVHQVPADYSIPSTSSALPPRPHRPPRNPSFAGTSSSSASIHEQANLFYPLRRQFVAKAGSRSEGNRILIIELCHALEEYSTTLTAQWEAQHRRVTSASSIPMQYRQSSSASSDSENALAKLQLLAGEVDSLVREIVEAVPAFSYALGQGSYGPLPFPINNGHCIPEEPSIRGYLEEVQILPRLSEAETELGETDHETWWPARLRADLNEGILLDGVQDSPSSMNFHSFAMVVPVTTEDMGRSYSGDTDRNDQLLEEGRRRWLEYKQARQ